MWSRAIPVFISPADADQTAIPHVDWDKQLFSLLGGYRALPKNHDVRINVVVDGCENINRMKSHAFQNNVHHGFSIEYGELLRQLHIVDIVVKQLSLHISEVFRDIQLMFLLQRRNGLLDLLEPSFSFELCDGL